MEAHLELEARLAAFKGRETALLFGSGYLANTGVIAALAEAGQVVFSDELNHASIIDGCRLARAEVFVYRHRDLEHLEWGIARSGGRGSVIVTDSVFSMDGDVAPLAGLVELARRHRLRLIADEAHGTGALGPGGRGAVAAAGLSAEVDVIVGTLGKALGSYGAFIACDGKMAQLLTNVARTFIFSTALPPHVVAAAGAALSVLEREPERVERLQSNAALLRAELGAAPGTHIVPLIVGEAESAVEACEAALERGVFAQAIRPPTVPPGTSRLRLSVMATHEPGDLTRAADTLTEVVRRPLAPAVA
jgi:glycine C-acetyltransferase/8-amino-7-oxononanoate synthase